MAWASRQTGAYMGPPSSLGTLLSGTACLSLLGSPSWHPKLTLVISHLLLTAAWLCLAGESALLNPWLSYRKAHKAQWLQLSPVTTLLTSNCHHGPRLLGLGASYPSSPPKETKQLFIWRL